MEPEQRKETVGYPTIRPDEATPENIKNMLDSGKHIYVLDGAAYGVPIYRAEKAGKGVYIFQITYYSPEHWMVFEATDEGLTRLAFYLAFSGLDYA